jgi:hypothetical protein
MYTLITGASSGIGKASAERLASDGHNLILIARRLERLQELQQELQERHKIEVKVYQVDVSDPQQIEDFFNSIEDLQVNVLVNNAGLSLGKVEFTDYNWEDFSTMIDVNIKGFLKVAHQATPKLKETQGHIINISSIAGIEGYEGGSVYCASKAFVKMISDTLRKDLLNSKVRVTDIAPGSVNTEFSTIRFKGDKQKADSVYQGFTPLYAEDIADCISFALSRPKHVCIDYMLVMATAQAGACRLCRD